MAAEDAPKPDPDATRRGDHAGAKPRPGNSARVRGEAGSRVATHDRRGGHGLDVRASTHSGDGGGDHVALVVEVSAAFAAAIRAAARDAEADAMRAEPTVEACEAAFEHMHAKVRAAARALMRGQEPPPAP
jgi:hypothetical protein